MPLEGIGSTIPDEAAFKKFAKTMAWNLKKHEIGDGDQGYGVDEDGTDGSKLSGKVTVDAAQLKALREATVAKPYPVDVIYRPASGVKITNRVWVFATVKNTLPNSKTTPAVGPDKTNGVVYYADDYAMPFRLRHGHTDDDVRSRGNIRVYDYYDYMHETAAELPTLADMSKPADRQKLKIQSINQVRNAPQPGIISPPVKVSYAWEKNTDNHHTKGVNTIGSLDINLFSDVLLHVRQIIRDPSDEIVVPDEGYLTIRNTVNRGGLVVDPDYHSQAVVKSGKTESTLDFTTFAVETDHLKNASEEVNLSAVIPEFYQYEGFRMTDQAADPNGTSHKTGTPTATSGKISLNRSTIDNKEEFWLTIYLKPVKESGKSTNKTPQPYSWDYKHNDLGKIQPK
ncbi:hypothetical protein [Enterococcus sp. AZ072]|uniref:hypothetical protein n=1 Tax=unclassified Enterococcus TaxID=2608891 RepID=UPI003D2DDC85